MNKKPIDLQYHTVFQGIINRNDYQNAFIDLRRNTVKLFDSWISIGESIFTYYDISDVKIRKVFKSSPNNLFEFAFQEDINENIF